MSEGKSGKMGMVLLWGTIIVIGIVFFKMTRQPNETEAQLATPESALQFYLQAAWDHTHATDNTHLARIEACVPKADMDWFNANYESLFADTEDFSSATDPTTMGASKKFLVMRAVLEAGVYRPDAPRQSQGVAGSTAVIVCEKENDFGQKLQIPVTLVQEGKVWKVKDFAGGKTAIASYGGPVTGI